MVAKVVKQSVLAHLSPQSAPGVGAQLQSSGGREGGGSDFQPGDQPPVHVLGRRGFSLIAR